MFGTRQNYIFVMRDDAAWEVGPFPDHQSMQKWMQHEKENGGDPRHWAVSLFPVEVENPMPITWHPGYSP